MVNNITSLGGHALIAGVIGHDEPGRSIVHHLRENNVITDGLIVEEKRPTTIKTRIIAHSQQVVRFDREVKEDISEDTQDILLKYVREHLDKGVNAIVLSDYCKGVITRRVVSEIVAMAGERGIMVAVDPKVPHFDYYQKVDILTPNTDEASAGARVEITDDGSVLEAGKAIMVAWLVTAVYYFYQYILRSAPAVMRSMASSKSCMVTSVRSRRAASRWKPP